MSSIKRAVTLTLLLVLVSCYSRYQEDLPAPSEMPENEIKGVVRLNAEGEEESVVFERRTVVDYSDSGITAISPRGWATFHPRDSIEALIYHRFSPGKTVAAVVLVPVAAVGIVALAVVASSCPIIYVDDGGSYRAVAEPLGGAITRGLARTDLSELEGLGPVDGEYRILIANELEETQHIDAFSLLVVDHPAGSMAVPDRIGRLLRVDAPRPPASARTGSRDVRPALARSDRARWTPEAAPEIAGGGPVRDTLTLEFERPAGDAAVLVVKGGTSEQGAYTLRRMLELWGEQVPSWYTLLDTSPQVRQANEEWVLREELWALKVRVLETGGWAEQDVIIGGGPIIDELQAVPLDLARVTGATVQVQLHVPRGFWSFDYVALSPGPVTELSGRELHADSAAFGGVDIRPALAAVDGDELVLPVRGDQTELRFLAPQLPAAGLERTVFARTHGFYRIHLDETGPRMAAALDSLWLIPGHPVRFAAASYHGMGTSPIEPAGR